MTADDPRGQRRQRSDAVRTGDHQLVREVNQALVLELVRDQPRSRADLAVATGLNKATIGKVVERLIDEGLIRDAGSTPQGLGRPPVMLEIDPDAGGVIGAELGVDYLNVILTDFAGKRLADAHADVIAAHGPTLAIRALQRLLDVVIEKAGIDEHDVVGMGLSVCGLVDQASGDIVFSPNHGWSDVPIREDLERGRDFPLFIENDACISAIGEEFFGVAKGVEDFVMVTGSAGLGTGIVAGGRLLRGSTGWAGEFGHMTIDPDGPPCRCGNRGCWEALASDRALFRRLGMGTRAVDDRQPPRGSVTERWYRIREITEAAEAGDEAAATALRDTGRYLGIGIANIINAINPRLVVVGGGLSLAADRLLSEVEVVVAERALAAPREACRITAAAHGIDVCAMGGVALALSELYTPAHLRVARPA